ncbi:hypothetical protein, partial [Pseudomonas viridiflava]|uniref:hypothetical protein n=1 Tax=Pseudomonas viridiflava TaxID=33069 RepID=UPI001B7FF96D
VGGGLPAMSDDAIFLTHRVDCIAGKPPLMVRCLLRDSATSKTWWCLPQDVSACQSADRAFVKARSRVPQFNTLNLQRNHP